MAKVRFSNVWNVSDEVLKILAPAFGLHMASKMAIQVLLRTKSEAELQKLCEELYSVLNKNRVVLDGRDDQSTETEV